MLECHKVTAKSQKYHLYIKTAKKEKFYDKTVSCEVEAQLY